MSTRTKASSSSPNVLLIMADQWPAAVLGAAGHPCVQTPSLDRLAANGIRFTNAYSECPVCIPARRTIMTGTTPRTHGDRTFQAGLRMPDMPTLASCFRDAGYQAYGVGKLHIHPQRDRIGFDDVLLAEEGRSRHGTVDDYEIFLADQGHAGQQFMHGLNNNEFFHRPWHLPEHCHVTNWITAQAARVIKRRDPTRPAFWYVSYTHPHPPLAPLACYLDLYRDVEVNAPHQGTWDQDIDALPVPLQRIATRWPLRRPDEHAALRRAYYALITHIDHQMRLIIGTLREENLLDDTVVMFVSDHGEMLGDFGLWAKRLFYEASACVPMIVMGRRGDDRVPIGQVDDRLVGLQDVMPTLLDLAGLDIPGTVDGISAVGGHKRAHLYGEFGEEVEATRMLHDGRHKLIWYPAGNRVQLFDLQEDPGETVDRAEDAAYREVRETLSAALVREAYGVDEAWVRDGKLIGMEPPMLPKVANRGLSMQRGVHFPAPPVINPDVPFDRNN